MICMFVGQRSLDIGFTAMSLVYGTSPPLHFEDTRFDRPTDFLAFSLIVYLVVRSNVNKVPIPGLFKTIAQDATSYFLVIFTSHLLLVLFLLFASVRRSS